jgi:hypothetical protein
MLIALFFVVVLAGFLFYLYKRNTVKLGSVINVIDNDVKADVVAVKTDVAADVLLVKTDAVAAVAVVSDVKTIV